MTAIESVLDELNRTYGFLASLLVRRDGSVIARVGDAKEPAWNDPYNMAFRDAASVARTFAYLDQQQSPQTFAQGTREVLLFKPRADVLLGLVKDDPRGAVEMARLSLKLGQELADWFAGVDLG